MKNKITSSNKKSLADLTIPRNFLPGSEEKINLLRERARQGKPLFVPGEPHFYRSPEASFSGLLAGSLPSRQQGEDSAQETLPKQGREKNRSQSSVSFRHKRSAPKPVSRAQRKAEPTATERTESSVESWRGDSLVMPVRESIPDDVLKALATLAQSPNSAITGAEEMLAELQSKREGNLPLPAISPAA
jgi:hypothetical protein